MSVDPVVSFRIDHRALLITSGAPHQTQVRYRSRPRVALDTVLWFTTTDPIAMRGNILAGGLSRGRVPKASFQFSLHA